VEVTAGLEPGDRVAHRNLDDAARSAR